MSKAKLHKIQVRNNPKFEGMVTTGANTQVLLDGELIKGCKSFKYEVEAGGIAKVTLEMYAEVETDIQTVLVKSDPEDTNLTIQGKSVAIYVLSSPFPLTHAQLEAENYRECE